VLFPGTVFPILVGRESSVAAAEQALRAERPIGILMQKDTELAEPRAADLHGIGTIALILRYITLPDGGHHVVVQCQQRFRVKEFISETPVLAVRFEAIDEPEAHGTDIEARVLHLRQQTLEALQLLPNVPPPLVAAVQNTAGAGRWRIWWPPTWSWSAPTGRRCWRPSMWPSASTRSRRCWPSASR